MNQKSILKFLRQVMTHNNREWFQDHKKDYEAVRAEFERGVQQAIERIMTFDPEIAHVQVKDCTYRFYRATRFSEDKSPYKRHFGLYIAAHGKKAFHGGYYLHIEPEACMLAGGAYCLPTDILRAVRQSVVDEIDEFRSIVEEPEFRRLFPTLGMDRVKTVPKGFPRDFPFPEYIRPKDYSLSTAIPDDFLRQADWLQQTLHVFEVMKPFLDFINYTIDDYE